ncbi:MULTISPECIES: cytochrome P450 [unclassified Variovorax]|uniref:cytochrome P450 n=1 Tax=unclassified Variovorax TaxID=663243 RepID=UPI00076BDA51|nr:MULTISPECIES: cytochrome P450 [unclassified Variovorax]KWT98655.1 putative cytochrome P450 hydroxylase [Variovorax sp. WDL1]PNG59382.1 Biotin biosynthesis cytochrome P450 [Variovorax sp. B4]PNG60827.1 Biotin biosynthesis cytochrome P450 [Variovorax sp. B2]VTV13254.1 Biotin biosynthesis cytochrome P450 [Variovorax sp. WDL1]
MSSSAPPAKPSRAPRSGVLAPASPDLSGFDLRSPGPAFYENPYPWYAALREATPVRRMPDGSLLLTRHADCVAVYKDTHSFSSDKRAEYAPKYGVGSPLYEHHTTSLVFNDPPLHTRVRGLIAGALTARAIESMEDGLTHLVAGLLDRMEERQRAGGEVDLIEDFAAAIPVEVIGNLLGVPREERGPLRHWSLAILGALEPQPSEAQLEAGNRAVTEMVAYLRGLVLERRRHPGDPAHDVLTRLIQGEADGGDRLTENELYQNCIFILNAGHETTTNLIGNGLVALLEWPQEKQRLLDDPSLIRSAIEEFLRFESSNQLGNRIATVATRVGGVEVQPGTRITLCIGAANRDPAVFAEPDRLDITRSPNRHLAFGSGTHQCVGMNLARLEARVAISAFLARFPDYRLCGPVVRGGRVRFRGYLRVPLSLGLPIES